MSEYAVLPLADYVDACEATREMTGGTEKIPSGELAGKILSINTQEDLRAEMTAQDGLIEDIKEALKGKAAPGGGSVETCTFIYTSDGEPSISNIFYTSVSEGGELTHKRVTLGVKTVTLSDVACNSVVVVELDYSGLLGTLSGCVQLDSYTTRTSQNVRVFGTTVEAGGTATANNT